jgi:DnaJ family protein C protein 16
LNINPKNCIGTVIALNGFRKYFCVYHAKHPESNPSGSRVSCFKNCTINYVTLFH